jgi:hypothetical protein
MTNEKAIELMKQRAAQANDHVIFDPATMEARIGSDGRYHVYKRDGTTTLDHSSGVQDLSESIRRINQRNEKFWRDRIYGED